ncbi:hypothetical protein TREES_T100020430 [Tupaia chinensis]|uniref:Uncharacterized protein n=1 Tax=Tupaia chinensis TaxID=246437 RepID=L9KVV3_TUPCH|nr:hypothetical protein TREES_T100020430 [Tupaia chinensis]
MCSVLALGGDKTLPPTPYKPFLKRQSCSPVQGEGPLIEDELGRQVCSSLVSTSLAVRSEPRVWLVSAPNALLAWAVPVVHPIHGKTLPPTPYKPFLKRQSCSPVQGEGPLIEDELGRQVCSSLVSTSLAVRSEPRVWLVSAPNALLAWAVPVVHPIHGKVSDI